MAEPHLGVGEFQRFTERLFKQLDAIEAKQDQTNGRVTALETESKITKRLAAYISAGIGVVFTLVGLLISYFK